MDGSTKLFYLLSSQQAHHGQMMSKRYTNVDSVVGTTLFRRRLTMMCPLGYWIVVKRNITVLVGGSIIIAYQSVSGI